jgi:hypothetical protein
VVALLQFHTAVGVGDELLSQIALGRQIIEALVEQHPHLGGTA